MTLTEILGLVAIVAAIFWLQRRVGPAGRHRARRHAAGTGILIVVLGLSWACSAGDPSAKVVAPFDLYPNYETVKARSYGHGNDEPLGHFSDQGTVCIDNNLNKSVSPGQGWTWVYFNQGLRDFEGVAPLSAFNGIIAQPETFTSSLRGWCIEGFHLVPYGSGHYCEKDTL